MSIRINNKVSTFLSLLNHDYFFYLLFIDKVKKKYRIKEIIRKIKSSAMNISWHFSIFSLPQIDQCFRDFSFHDRSSIELSENIGIYFAGGDNLSASQQHDKKRETFLRSFAYESYVRKRKKFFFVHFSRKNRKQTGASWIESKSFSFIHTQYERDSLTRFFS